MKLKIEKFLTGLGRFFLAGILAVSAGSGLLGCASNKVEDSYYQANAGDFSTRFLDNGIPVIFKNTGRGQITVLRMIVEGGTPLLAPEKSGLEDVTFSLMFRGSQKYSYETMQQMEFDSSFGISASSGKDYSVAGIKCIDRDFETAFDVFQDSFFNPLMEQTEFDKIIQEERMRLARAAGDPSGVLGKMLQKTVYEGHEYQAASGVTEDSIGNITLEDVVSHYKTLLDSKRIKFVIVGNMSQDRDSAIAEKINEAFGKIQAGNYKTPVVSKVKLGKKTVYKECEQAGEIGYIAGYFDAPERYDADYVPFAIATMILDNEFFKYVREQNSACYSIGTGILGGKDILGMISVFKSSKNSEIKKLVYEAIDNFPKEKQIEAKLESYKAKYITSLFSSSQNTAGVATNIVISTEYSGEPSKYLTRSAEVQKVTASQVLKAYQKYIAPKKITWIVVSQKETLKDFEF